MKRRSRDAIAGFLVGVGLVALAAPGTAHADSAERAMFACLKKELTPAEFATVQRVRRSGGDTSTFSNSIRATFSGCLLTNGTRVGKAAARPPKLTVSPMDATRVTFASRFRSCAGHDFSGRSVEGVRESNRSMKTYLYVDVPWTSTGAIDVRAPFAGTVHMSQEGENALGTWVRVVHRNGWVFTAFHVDPVVKEGQRIGAGAPLATFPPRNAPQVIGDRMGEPQANFDFSLESIDGRLAPFVDNLTATAAAPWTARGFTPDALTISRQARDAAPCRADFPDGPGSDGFVSAQGA